MAKNQETRKIGVTGETESFFVIIPKYMARSLGWKKGQRVIVEQRRKDVVIREMDVSDSNNSESTSS